MSKKVCLSLTDPKDPTGQEYNGYNSGRHEVRPTGRKEYTDYVLGVPCCSEA